MTDDQWKLGRSFLTATLYGTTTAFIGSVGLDVIGIEGALNSSLSKDVFNCVALLSIMSDTARVNNDACANPQSP